MGGGGFLGLGDTPSAPATPDYTGAANATAQGNLDAARAAAAANRVNQVTPYGNLDYAITGSDPYGNPTWTATTSLNNVGQQLLNNQNQTSLGLGQTINAQLGQVQNTMGQGFNPQTGPITTNAGQANLNANYQTNPNYASGMQGWDQANQILQARLRPQMAQDLESQNSALANQGIVQGTKAYENAMRTFNQGQNDLLTNSQLAGQQIGNSLFNQGITGGQFANQALGQQNATNQQQFANQIANANLGNQAQQQQYNQAMTNYNLPLNTLSALRTGAQVQNPSFVNAPQQATTAGADLLGATTAAGNYNLASSNASQAAQSGFNSGLMGLGGTLGAAAIMSDIRTKENIEPIGVANNGLTVYRYEYKPEFKDHELAGHGVHYGFMAQEVEQVFPYAVHTLNDGYKVIDYGVINA
jgi:Chaperone of endosialidase